MKLFDKILSKLKNKSLFNSSAYWNDRYESGGTSGAGSYGRLAEFKAQIINAFIEEHHVSSVIELGCGDGNQLGLIHTQSYCGIDVSQKSIEICVEKYREDHTKDFILYDPKYCTNRQNFISADCALSLDVVYHLVEDGVFERYMKFLFSLAKNFVIIYSSNDENLNNDPRLPRHIKHRNFTRWVADNEKDFSLISHTPNQYPLLNDGRNESFADFYIYSKKAD